MKDLVYPYNEIEEAKINFSAIWRISGEVFTQKASEVLNVPKERIEICRSIANDSTFGKLTVHIYKESDTNKQFWDFHNGATVYRYLSPNIFEFEKQLSMYKK